MFSLVFIICYDNHEWGLAKRDRREHLQSKGQERETAFDFLKHSLNVIARHQFSKFPDLSLALP